MSSNIQSGDKVSPETEDDENDDFQKAEIILGCPNNVSLQCCICHATKTNATRSIFNNSYCFECFNVRTFPVPI